MIHTKTTQKLRSFKLSEDFFSAFKVICSFEGLTMTIAIEELIEKFVAEKAHKYDFVRDAIPPHRIDKRLVKASDDRKRRAAAGAFQALIPQIALLSSLRGKEGEELKEELDVILDDIDAILKRSVAKARGKE